MVGSATESKIWDLLQQVTDPEIPVLTLQDLGVIRSVQVEGKKVKVELTPTYTGCPAMDTMASDVRKVLSENDFEPEVRLILSPAWTTDWLSDEGRRKMAVYGIAPPLEGMADKMALLQDAPMVKCTHCGSTHTRLISQFGSTACKALFQCQDCKEPFDYFKCLK